MVKFEDGQIMALQESSAFTVTQYSYNKQNPSASSAAFNFLRGGMRFITGVIGATRPQQVRIAAGNATIGIRGTDAYMSFDAVTQAITAAVNAGAAVLTTPLGATDILVNTFVTANPTTAPGTAQPIALGPANFVAAVRSSLSSTTRRIWAAISPGSWGSA